MSGPRPTESPTESSTPELQAAARRLAALADRLRALRAQLGGNAAEGTRPEQDQGPSEAGDRPEDQPH